MNQTEGLTLWHQFVENRDFSRLDDFIAEDAVLHSPVVWTPQKGKQIVSMYLIAAGNIIANKHFKYVREISNNQHTILEFATEIDGISVEGVDMLTFNDEGKLIDIKVMVRPLKALNIVHQKMGEFLMKMKNSK
ncbi:nuclear transport factor 2 family protein [Aquimarina sp. 2201CG5-10]|uniref:nuclear transport factor 2 family protein n=1 Tax=Aquimarina callyspongiae TaxID=3098150 RepID=UPI002AB37F2F|nr:nuclear transport factor 2 family protein [Aquimarina sp. 2201CG5-10]MDY8138736.1 nuclear transport factor 2 family protein [Aquimarina sp. 2201CG5-10]